MVSIINNKLGKAKLKYHATFGQLMPDRNKIQLDFKPV